MLAAMSETCNHVAFKRQACMTVTHGQVVYETFTSVYCCNYNTTLRDSGKICKFSNSINVIKVKIVIEYRRPELSISNYYQYSCQMDYLLVLCMENDVDCLLREIYRKLDTTTSILPQTKNTPSTRCASFACTSSFIVHFRAILISRKHRGLPIPNHESRQREKRDELPSAFCRTTNHHSIAVSMMG
jgi:hypothetical protein